MKSGERRIQFMIAIVDAQGRIEPAMDSFEWNREFVKLSISDFE
jgi:hypothetical protein